MRTTDLASRLHWGVPPTNNPGDTNMTTIDITQLAAVHGGERHYVTTPNTGTGLRGNGAYAKCYFNAPTSPFEPGKLTCPGGAFIPAGSSVTMQPAEPGTPAE
jgi:hypothetical protein